MTDDHAPFLAAIAAQPGDATPRLIYADWLEEQGDAARAEAWRWLVKEKRQPGEYQGRMKRPYCWVIGTPMGKIIIEPLRLASSCLLPGNVFYRARKHYKEREKTENTVLEFSTVIDAELAAIEAMAELIHEEQPSM